MKFKESALAHFYLDHLTGVEIGGSAHNPFNLPNCKNVDYTDDMNTGFKEGEFKMCGEKLPVDIVADGAHLPFKAGTLDYVISSHVIEHFFDPIATLKEWKRVIKKGGYIFIIAPLQNATAPEIFPCTPLDELIKRHEGHILESESKINGSYGHWSVWNLPEFLELCDYMKLKVIESLPVDDKVGNGFCCVIQK
jgi:SAM-dependent methyltransferase